VRIRAIRVKILPALHPAELNYILFMRQIFVTMVLVIIFIAGIWLGFKLTRWMNSVSGLHEESTATVVEQVQTLSDLVTVKYVMDKIEIIDNPPENILGQFGLQGDNRILLLAHGVVKAGIDLKRLGSGDVEISGKKIVINLPPPQITDAYLDEKQTKVIDWKKGFLRDFDKDLEQTARQNAVDDIRLAARQNGILSDASERAQLELALFLHQAGFEQVEFSSEKGLLHKSMPQF
jgi:hypothetical protein